VLVVIDHRRGHGDEDVVVGERRDLDVKSSRDLKFTGAAKAEPCLSNI
jgi:hypothetical protein